MGGSEASLAGSITSQQKEPLGGVRAWCAWNEPMPSITFAASATGVEFCITVARSTIKAINSGVLGFARTSEVAKNQGEAGMLHGSLTCRINVSTGTRRTFSRDVCSPEVEN